MSRTAKDECMDTWIEEYEEWLEEERWQGPVRVVRMHPHKGAHPRIRHDK